HPWLSAAVARRVETWPGLDARIARIHRHRIENPLTLAGFRIVRLQVSGCVEIVTGADDHVIANDDRSHRREVLLIERRDLDMPHFFAGARIDLDQEVVVRLHEEVVAPHADATMARVRSATRLPIELPENRPVARIDGPEIVRRRRVEDA